MKKNLLLLTCLIVIVLCKAQSDYTVGTKHPEGVATVSKYIKINNYKGENRYGLIDEKTNKLVLPISYLNIYPAREKELFIVKDTLHKYGIYSIKNGFVVNPQYTEIELFQEGLAVVHAPGNASFSTLFGAVDNTGKIIIPLTYNYIASSSEGLLNFRQEGKFGFINHKNEVVIPAKYTNTAAFVSGLAPAQEEQSKYGYINKTGQWVIQPAWADADNFYEGYARVYSAKKINSRNGSIGNDTMGIIDLEGKIVIPVIYNNVSIKQNGGVFVAELGKKAVLLDSTGKILLTLEEHQIGGSFTGRYATLKKEDRQGLIDAKGKIVLEPVYKSVYITSDESVIARKDNKVSVLDKNAKQIIAPDTAETILSGKKHYVSVFKHAVKIYDKTGRLLKTISQENLKPFAVGFIANEDSLRISHGRIVYLKNFVSGKTKTMYYYDIGDFNDEGIAVARPTYSEYIFIDKEGNQLNTTKYSNVINFSDGIGAVQEKNTEAPYLVDKTFKKIATLKTVFHGPYAEGLAKAMNGTYYVGYLDKTGKEVFNVSGTDGAAFKENRARIKRTTDKWYYIDKKGKQVSKEDYENALDFAEGVAAVKKNGKWGFIDTSGNTVINFQYDGVSGFQTGAAIVKTGNDFFLINSSGIAIGNIKYSGGANPVKGSFPVKKEEKYGIIDSKGRTVIAFNYENITPVSEGLAWAMKNKKWGLVNNTGKEITPFEYDDASAFKNGYAGVVKNKKMGLVDKTGKLVLPIQYDQIGNVFDNRILFVTNEGEYRVALPK